MRRSLWDWLPLVLLGISAVFTIPILLAGFLGYFDDSVGSSSRDADATEEAGPEGVTLLCDVALDICLAKQRLMQAAINELDAWAREQATLAQSETKRADLSTKLAAWLLDYQGGEALLPQGFEEGFPPRWHILIKAPVDGVVSVRYEVEP